MLRLTFVLLLVGVGTYYALQRPFYALLFYVGNAYFRPEDWAYGDFVRSLKLSLFVGIYVVCSTLLSREKLFWDRRVVLLWLFLAVSLLSSLMSEYSDYSWPFALEFIKIIAITYILVIVTTDLERFRLVVAVMVLSLGLEQGKQGWFYLLTSPGGANSNPVAFLGDNNGTAVGMLMLVPLIGLLIQSSQHKWVKRFFGFLLIGCLYRALSTYSRGGFLAAIAMGVVWGARSVNRVRIFAAGILLVVIIVPMLPSAFWERMGTIQSFEEQKDESALGRLHFWSVALRMAAANPVLGVGFNSYNRAYDSYDFSDGAYGKGRSVHSSFFGILAETGYVGALFYLMSLVTAFRACAYVRRIGVSHPELRHLAESAVALETCLIVFLVGGSFVPFQYNEMFWHILGLAIALRHIAERQERAAELSRNSHQIIVSPLVPRWSQTAA